MDNQIDIGIACMKGSERFTYFCLVTLIKLAKNPENLNIYLGIDLNTEKSHNGIKINKIKQLCPNININIITTGFKRSSISHAIILNNLYSKFTSRYCIIMDNDIAILKKHWDEFLIKEMTEKEYVITGMPYDDTHHYQNFPSATFVFFDNKFIAPLKIDFRPPGWYNPSPPPFKKVNQELHEIYGNKIGTVIRFDTGTELYDKIKVQHNMKYHTFTNSPNRLNGISHFLYDDISFLTHHDGGSKIGHKIAKPKIWINLVSKHIKITTQIDLENNVDKLFTDINDQWFD